MAATKTKSTELSNVDFLIKTLRNVAEYEGEDASIRLRACDRIALVAGIYRVEKGNGNVS